MKRGFSFFFVFFLFLKAAISVSKTPSWTLLFYISADAKQLEATERFVEHLKKVFLNPIFQKKPIRAIILFDSIFWQLPPALMVFQNGKMKEELLEVKGPDPHSWKDDYKLSLNMGDPAALKMLFQALSRYQLFSDHYLLFLDGHGSAWEGFAWDEHSGLVDQGKQPISLKGKTFSFSVPLDGVETEITIGTFEKQTSLEKMLNLKKKTWKLRLLLPKFLEVIQKLKNHSVSEIQNTQAPFAEKVFLKLKSSSKAPFQLKNREVPIEISFKTLKRKRNQAVFSWKEALISASIKFQWKIMHPPQRGAHNQKDSPIHLWWSMNPSSLKISSLKKVFQEVLGTQRWDALVFNGCLMGMVDVFYEFAPFFRSFLAASSELDQAGPDFEAFMEPRKRFLYPSYLKYNLNFSFLISQKDLSPEGIFKSLLWSRIVGEDKDGKWFSIHIPSQVKDKATFLKNKLDLLNKINKTKKKNQKKKPHKITISSRNFFYLKTKPFLRWVRFFKTRFASVLEKTLPLTFFDLFSVAPLLENETGPLGRTLLEGKTFFSFFKKRAFFKSVFSEKILLRNELLFQDAYTSVSDHVFGPSLFFPSVQVFENRSQFLKHYQEVFSFRFENETHWKKIVLQELEKWKKEKGYFWNGSILRYGEDDY